MAQEGFSAVLTDTINNATPAAAIGTFKAVKSGMMLGLIPAMIRTTAEGTAPAAIALRSSVPASSTSVLVAGVLLRMRTIRPIINAALMHAPEACGTYATSTEWACAASILLFPIRRV